MHIVAYLTGFSISTKYNFFSNLKNNAKYLHLRKSCNGLTDNTELSHIVFEQCRSLKK